MRKIVIIAAIIVAATCADLMAANVPHAVESIRISSVPFESVYFDRSMEAVLDDFRFSHPGGDAGPSLAASFTGGGSRFKSAPPVTDWVSQASFDYDRASENTTGPSTPVPEPMSMVLLGLGLVGGRLAARRRKIE